MVFSRSDVKRKTKEVHDPLGENPKRTKVHAQRKFAQGSGMNSPIMTPIKEKEKTKPNGAPSPAELLPSKRPTTEDFLSFLCFRGTKVLPPRLDFFNEASGSEKSDNVTQANSSKQTAASPSGVQKIKPRNAGTQVYKKTSADRQTGLQKGNAMRARTASDERQNLRKNRIERQLKLRKKAAQIKAKNIRKTHPSILKRLGANRLRVGLRSGGQLPPGSEVGLKTDRKPKRGRPKRPRIKKKMDSVPQKRLKREEEANDESEESISEEEFQEEESGDEETEEADKKPLKKSNMTMRTRGASNSPAQSPKKQGVSSRPSRKTKEAATLYMEMITKDLRNPDEDDDDDDEDYVRNFPELPSVIKKEKEDEAKQRSPKRVKQEKRPSSPNKSDRGKAVKNEKVKEEDDEDNEPLLKRSQRLLQVKRISPKGKTNTKFRGRPKLKGCQINKDEPPKNTKDFLKKKGNRKRESKNTSDSIIDDDEEEDEWNDSSLNSRDEKRYRKGNADSSNLNKSRYSRRSDIKKNDEMDEAIKDISSKKRKSMPAILSEEIDLSEVEDDNIELSGSSKKVRRSADEVLETKKAKSTDQRKTKKSSVDLKQVESISKRVSTRTIKKELNESEYEEEDSKEKPTTRGKRIKNESDDDVPVRKSKAGRRKIKYKEETDEEEDEDEEEEEEEEETPVKLRGHLQRKAKIKDEIDDIHDKNVKKYNQTQQPRAKSKDESDEEVVSSSKKDRESLQRRVKNRIDNEVEFDNSVKKIREPPQRKLKNSSSENDKNTEMIKLREPGQRKQKIKEESDEENESNKKTRESSQRKVKYSYDSDEEVERIPKKLREPLERKVKNKEEESDEEIDLVPKKSRESLQRRVKIKEASDDEITNVRKQKSSLQRKSKIKDDSEEEEIISVKKTRGSLQRKIKAKVDSDVEFDESNPTKTREHLQRKSKKKENYNESPQNLVDDSPSSEEDEEEIAGSSRESSARKLLNNQIKDNKIKRSEQLRKSKSKSDDTENQEKPPHEVFQKTLKGKVKIEGVQSDFKKNDQQQRNISSKEQKSSKENIVDSDDNSVNLPHGPLDSDKKDDDLIEKKTDKARAQQKRSKSCTSGSEKVEGKSEDVQGLNDSVGKTKKVINLGQNKDSNLEVDENVNEARKEGEKSLLVDEEIEKSSKVNVKNKGKKGVSMNESELKEHIVKEELKQQKSKTNMDSETVASIQDDQFKSKTRTSMKDNELEDSSIKEGDSFCKEDPIKTEKESISDKEPKEFARLNKSSKNTSSENIEEQNTQKTRTMPRRGSRKGYEESDDESEDFKIQGKQSSKMATRNENFENISDSESDGKCRGLKVIEPEEKDLLKANESQKKNRKSVPVNKIKKELNEEEEVNKLKVKGDEITLSSTQVEPVTSVKNEPEVPDKMFKNKNDKYIATRNIKTEDSPAKMREVEDDSAGIKQNQGRELIQKDSLQKREIVTPNGDFCMQRKVEPLKLDGNEQDIHQATVMKVEIEEAAKNVHEHSHKLIKEQNEAILDKKKAEKCFDDQRKTSKKAKAVSNENSDGKTKFDRSNIVDYETGQVNFSYESNLANKSNEENIESNIEVKLSPDEVVQKSSSKSGADKINIKKGNDIDRRKFKKSSSDATLPEPRRKSRDSDRKLSKKNDEFSGDREIKERKLDLSPDDKYKLKRSTRFSTGNHEEKLIVKISDRGSYFADTDKTVSFDRSDSSSIPPRTSVRKPSLNARAIERDVKSNDLAKVPASIKRKSVGERDSCDTVGSGSSGIIDCKVVLEALGNIPIDSYKLSKKTKNSDKNASGKTVGIKTGEEPLVKSKNSSISNKTSCLETSETLPFEEKKEISEKQVPKPSISETWRQAFKNAKIPKPGHLSPVQHSVKPFVRQKLPGSPLLSTTFPGKGSDGTETKAQEVNKSKVTSSLSPFKSLIANQNQRSLSPDAKRHTSPAHKAGYESPLRRNDDIKTDFRKHEAPVKSLTQLQYEKRSSEFISSLDSGPSVLPGFESIRAYKKDMKKDEPKEIKTEVLDTPAPPEAIVKPSTEGKHLNLPLAVEHTLRKMSPITVSKKPPAKPISVKTETIPLTKPAPPPVVCEKKVAVEPVSSPTPVIPSPSGQLGPPNDLTIRDSSDISFLAKKKVNMTSEEIERWLSDSTSNGVEHKKDCGIFENNQCECSYRTSGASMQNSVGTSELVAKDDGKIDHGVVEPPVQLKELDKHGKYVAETISTCKVEEYKEKLLLKTNVSENKMAPPKSWKSSGQEKFKSNRSMTEEEMCEYDFRFDKMSNSPRESVSDVSSVTHRDDASSSSEVPERKIFHQKRERCRDAPGPKRPSISSPTAFSAENESSVYAFKPDPPSHTNRPFRRGRGKSGEPDDRKGMSSSSVAVQVNLKESLETSQKLESETVLESSTQTERPNDDNEGHLFYIPLPDEQLQSGLPHGVAVKLDTEGPDQRVIMRAKLVTKPSSSFPPAYNSRSLVTSSRSNHQKPEQKVRPLWSGSGKAPFVAVPPTMREPLTSDQGTTTNPEKKPQQPDKSQVAQTSQSTQINQGCSKGPESPRSRSSSKAQKQSEPLPQPSSPPTAIEWKGTEFPPPDIPATLVEAPTFYPSEKDFQDPLEYIEQLTPLAQSFGICRIVPPSSFKPECKVSDDMRFTAYNQYVHKMMERWGPNVRELCAIRKYLATQSITLVQLPMIGSMEVDLPRLYQTVQQCGGLKEVIEKKRWAKVADAMRIPKSAQDRVTKLDDIYCKYLLPYDTLSHEERTKLLEEADEEWKEREKRLASDEDSGNNGSGEGSDESSEADDNIFECITKGKSMPLSVFFRIARNTMATWFKDTSPSPSEVEAEFWRHVSTKTCHVCVHCGSIDSGTWGYGFPITKTSSTSRHPWNLKILTNSPGSILRSLGPLMGVTVPTLHVGMLFSSCCWYRDPHALPWIEYLHTGASKIWYGVPDSRASELRKAMYPLLPRHIRDRKIWLPSDTMMVPPQFLLDGGVSLCRVVQEPGQFILVFPKAFTSSICTGYLVSESVYFAQPSWLNTAVQVFKDIQDSCEPPVFSLDKLLFMIANDTKSSADILIQVLPMLKDAIEKEVESRKKLRDLGLTSWERLPSHKSGRRKKKEEEQSDMECDTCRGSLYLSVVSNSNEDCSYCIDHAIESLTKDQSLVKYCKPMFAFDEEEMEELIDKVKARIETKTQKKQKEKGVSSGTKN